jgi:hypothetical protein
MARSRDISKVLSSNTALATDAELGLSLITPTSVATTGGSGSISTSGAISFTSASAISLNNVFSSTYDNYRIFATATVVTAATYMSLRLRVNNADNSSTNYRLGNIRLRTQSGEGVFAAVTNNATSADLVRMDNTSGQSWTFDTSIDIGQPFLSQFTTFKGMGTSTAVVGTNQGEAQYVNGFFIDSTSFTGFTLFAPSGTFTGTVRVYGYRN